MTCLHKTGVYSIADRKGRFYIGSSSESIHKRWLRHKADLRKNKHHSPYLQRVYNKHGLDYLTFSVVHECEPSQCLEFEQIYLDLIQPHFNTCKMAASSKGINLTKETRDAMAVSSRKSDFKGKHRVIDPQGQIHEFYNITRFSQENNLIDIRLNAVILGHNYHHKGWTITWENHKKWLKKEEFKCLKKIKSTGKWTVTISNKHIGTYPTLELAKFSRDLYKAILWP